MPETDPKRRTMLANLLRNLRTYFYPRLTAKEFAEKAGVPQNYLSKVESGAVLVPRKKELLLLAEQFREGNDYLPVIERLHTALEKQEFFYDPNDAWFNDVMLILENDFVPTKAVYTSHTILRPGRLLRLKKTKLIYTVPFIERVLKDVPNDELVAYRDLPYPLSDALVLEGCLQQYHNLEIYDDALISLNDGDVLTAYYPRIDDRNYWFEHHYKLPFNQDGECVIDHIEGTTPPNALYLKTATLGQYLDYRKKTSLLTPP
jgi:transcriptional regulator with XRE-family HTH domain